MNHQFHSANGKHSAEAIRAVAVSGPISKSQLEPIQTRIARLRGISVGEPLTGFTSGLTAVPNDGRESFQVESSPAI